MLVFRGKIPHKILNIHSRCLEIASPLTKGPMEALKQHCLQINRLIKAGLQVSFIMYHKYLAIFSSQSMANRAAAISGLGSWLTWLAWLTCHDAMCFHIISDSHLNNLVAVSCIPALCHPLLVPSLQRLISFSFRQKVESDRNKHRRCQCSSLPNCQSFHLFPAHSRLCSFLDISS